MAEVRRGTSLLKKAAAECDDGLSDTVNAVSNDIVLVKPTQPISRVVPREPAPEFTAQAVFRGTLQDVQLADYSGKWLVLVFSPLDDELEIKQLLAFSDAIDTFKGLGVEVLASSCSSVKTQLFLTARSVAQGGVGHTRMPLVADADGQLAKSYGVYGESLSSEKRPLRAMFIIDPNGILKSASIDDDGKDWRPSQWVFDSLRKIQELAVSEPLNETKSEVDLWVTRIPHESETNKREATEADEKQPEHEVAEAAEQAPKPTSKAEKKEKTPSEANANHIIVVVKGPSHQEVHFKVNKATKFKEIMKAYCEEMDLDVNRLRFSFEGDRVFKDFTPCEVGMESGDRLECYKVR